VIEPYWKIPEGKIYQGHALHVLPELKPKSVHMVVTSPPYWGLRDYDLEPQLWDSDPECQHVWGDKSKKNLITPRSERENWNSSDGHAKNQERVGGVSTVEASRGQFCQHCNAWRGSLGLEPTPELFISHIVQIFREFRRVLRDDGTLWMNMGDSYFGDSPVRKSGQEQFDPSHQTVLKRSAGGTRRSAKSVSGLKPKDLCMMPARIAIALQDDGWWIRSKIPWVKRSAMPESVTDRPASALEYMFLLSKSQKYFYDAEAIKIISSTNDNRKPYAPGQVDNRGNGHDRNGGHHTDRDASTRNFRNTDLFFQSISEPHGMIFCDDEMVGIDVNPKGFSEAHFATFPPKLIEPCILAGTSEKGCCPECGVQWVRVVESSGGRDWHKDDMKDKGIPGQIAGENGNKRGQSTSPLNDTKNHKTVGWKPSCECDTPTTRDWGGRGIPSTVLDPFGGAMTTAIVAAKHGRKFIMIELSETYIDDIGIPRIKRETAQLKLF